jgi:hypothetical protein
MQRWCILTCNAYIFTQLAYIAKCRTLKFLDRPMSTDSGRVRLLEELCCRKNAITESARDEPFAIAKQCCPVLPSV